MNEEQVRKNRFTRKNRGNSKMNASVLVKEKRARTYCMIWIMACKVVSKFILYACAFLSCRREAVYPIRYHMYANSSRIDFLKP